MYMCDQVYYCRCAHLFMNIYTLTSHYMHAYAYIVKTFLLTLKLLLAAMTYNQVHYFRVNHLADFTQNGHTKIPVG